MKTYDYKDEQKDVKGKVSAAFRSLVGQDNGFFIFAVEASLTFPDLRYVQTERLNAIQELQTMSYHKLPLKLFIMNNFGYGIIKQFQDTWLEARHEASGRVYSQPDFKKIAHAYNVSYRKISSPRDIVKEDLNSKEAVIFDVFLHPDTLIEPKKVTGNPLHNMFPYLDLSSDSLEKKYIK